MSMFSPKDVAEIPRTKFSDSPLGKFSEAKVFDKPASEYDKPLRLMKPSGEVKKVETVISSDSPEGKIYSEAKVDLENPTTEILQGTEYTVYKRELDKDLEGSDGRTNKERMANGEAPYVDRDGKLERVELHHEGQQNGTLIELDQKTHRTNNDVLHPMRGEGEGRGNDPAWDARRKEHWQNRAMEI